MPRSPAIATCTSNGTLAIDGPHAAVRHPQY